MAARILYDGWPLVHAPSGAAAAHLRTLLAAAPEGYEPLLALPAHIEVTDLPAGAQPIVAASKDRGHWEQQVLQQLAGEHGAACIHTTAPAAALLGKTPTLVSPAETGQAGRGRLAAAQASGGLARATLLWPDDLPKPPGRVALLPPVADVQAPAAALPADTPPEYLLYDGSSDREMLLNLLEGWTWGAASIGELYPLIITGLDETETAWLQTKLPEFHLADYVQAIPSTRTQLQSLIANSMAFITLEPPLPWGSSLRLALAHGKAIVGFHEPLTEAMAGSAAYLLAPGDLRSLGAAMITVVVEEGVRSSLEEQAKQKSAGWNASAFKSGLAELYASLESSPR